MFRPRIFRPSLRDGRLMPHASCVVFFIGFSGGVPVLYVVSNFFQLLLSWCWSFLFLRAIHFQRNLALNFSFFFTPGGKCSHLCVRFPYPSKLVMYESRPSAWPALDDCCGHGRGGVVRRLSSSLSAFAERTIVAVHVGSKYQWVTCHIVTVVPRFRVTNVPF
jgi:hypothetical protein